MKVIEEAEALARQPLVSSQVNGHERPDLTLSEAAGLYNVSSFKWGARFTFDRLSEKYGSEKAELSVFLLGEPVMPCKAIGLTSEGTQKQIAKALTESIPSVPWKDLLQNACAMVLQSKRTGRPAVKLTRFTQVEPFTYSVNPLIVRRKPVIIYGDGGQGKSSFALLLAAMVSTGQTIAGIRALQGRSLFLDWEDDEEVHARRLQALIAGHPELSDAEIDYLPCEEPLVRMIYPLVRRIQADGITFVVIDSLMAASGGDASSETVSKFFDAVRLLKTETLLLGHVPKTLAEGQEAQSVYGSVFNKNRARSTWEFKREQELGADTAVIGLFHRKSNHTRRHHPIGLTMTQDEACSVIRFEACDLRETAELANALPVASRIRNLLEDGIMRTPQDIAYELDVALSTIQRTLRKHKGHKWQMIGGPGMTTKWTVLNARNEIGN
ncbi:hypothetical protein W02_38320 [Nitrospira sp. KM1]|uniref:AAA family ATPase n=1 Tax=Nitrospira sp. KM1 TaxID=1936990 RepID=UPI0013A74FDB|nr:AAA family ATPase [Nitrospira sp. KM1]BCA56692.1 hypothetical protein W02_38320 [Nitrospira sp. KM1]